MPELNEATRRNIQSALARLDIGSGPIVVTAASHGHIDLLRNWLCHMTAVGLSSRVLVLAMDEEVASGIGDEAVAARAAFDGSIDDLWRQRALVWRLLSDSRVEFIHSDTDALWLRDPLGFCSEIDADLVFSQGTDFPLSTLSVWEFVLCCGFFVARSSAATAALFGELARTSDGAFDDQIALNELLVRAETRWDKGSTSSFYLSYAGSKFRCFAEPILGSCEVMDLKLALLPHQSFVRLPPGGAHPFIKHLLLKYETLDDRCAALRAHGCWKLDT